MKNMTDEDMAAAMTALIEWFVSQDIPPHSAGALLTKLAARQIVMAHDTLDDINAAIGLFHNQLVMEIAKAVEERNQQAGPLQ